MSDQKMTSLGPVKLASGVSRLNAGVYLFAAFAGIMLSTFVSVVQPYVLDVNLQLRLRGQGQNKSGGGSSCRDQRSE